MHGPGAMSAYQGGMATGSPSEDVPVPLEQLRHQGFDRPVIGVKVVNRGRAPTRVERWSVQVKGDGGTSLTPIGNLVGPPLPYDLPPGSSATWVTDLQNATALAHADAATFGGKLNPVYVVAELGTGRRLTSQNTLAV